MTFPLRGALCAMAAFCALQSGSLQAQTVLEFSGEQVSTPWAPAAGTFGRSVSGLLTPGAQRDVVVLCGATPFVLVDTDPYDAKVELPLAASDLDVLPAGAPGGLDALIGVGAAGVQLAWYGAASEAFVTQTIAGGAWSGAQMVRAIDVDGDGAADLVGLAADGSSLLVLTAQAAELQFAPAAGFSAGATVRDLIAVQWDGDPARELALLTDLGLEVRDADGTLLDSWQSVLPGGTMARLRQQGIATDRIAWITAYAPPALQYLMVLAPGGGVHDMVDLGALDAFAAVGGDYDLDGDDDLLVSHHFSHELIWFENERSPAQPLAQSFKPLMPALKLFRVGPPATGAALNHANPVRADLDGDGDLDLFYACQTSSSVEVLRGETIDQSALKPEVSGGVWRPEAAPEHGELVLDVELPAVVPPAATHLRLRVWRRDAAGSEFDPQATHVALMPLSGAWPAQLSIPIDECTPEFDATFALELELLHLDAEGQITQEFPASLWEFMSNEFTLDDLLGEIPGSMAQPIPTDSSIGSVSGTSHVMSRPKMGTFASGKVPSN